MGRIYILRNSNFGHLVKVGRTSLAIEERVRQLNGTGVPGKTVELFHCEVEDECAFERLIHFALDKGPGTRDKEWFKVSASEAMAEIRSVASTSGIPLRGEWISRDLASEDKCLWIAALRYGVREKMTLEQEAKVEIERLKLRVFKIKSSGMRSIFYRGDLLRSQQRLNAAEAALVKIAEDVTKLKDFAAMNEMTEAIRETAREWIDSVRDGGGVRLDIS